MRLLCVFALAVAAYGQQWHQIRVFTGFNALEGIGVGDHPSVGAGYDIGLTRNLAVTTGYTWNLIDTFSEDIWVGGVTRVPIRARASVHDLMGGLRLQAPIGRVTPFVSPLGGVAIATGVARVADAKQTDSVAKPAAGVGTGVEVRIGRGWSFLVEGKAIRPLDLRWYGHVGFGFTYRTKWGQSR